MVEGSNYSRYQLKRRLVQEGLLEYRCYGDGCKLSSEWLGKKLSLQLDHINGRGNDNRIENLRFLCPNCHSQTPTFAGRNLRKKKECVDCGTDISHTATRCRPCSHQIPRSTRRFEVSVEELKKLLDKYPMTKIGEMFGVSGNAIKKRAKKLGIIK